MERKSVIVAVRVGPSAAEDEAEFVVVTVEKLDVRSSEREMVVENDTWPKSRPWMSPEDEKKRWRIEARVVPEI